MSLTAWLATLCGDWLAGWLAGWMADWLAIAGGYWGRWGQLASQSALNRQLLADALADPLIYADVRTFNDEMQFQCNAKCSSSVGEYSPLLRYIHT